MTTMQPFTGYTLQEYIDLKRNFERWAYGDNVELILDSEDFYKDVKKLSHEISGYISNYDESTVESAIGCFRLEILIDDLADKYKLSKNNLPKVD